MRLVLLLLLFLWQAETAVAQTELLTDSLALVKLKAQIKEELKAELTAEMQKEKVSETSSEKRSPLNLSRFSLKGYGVVNYYAYNHDTDPNLRRKIDAERLNLYLGYEFTPKIVLKSEIEFEHGGTGSTIELDTQEEFGEFEQEIESGGEVKLEQLNIAFSIHPKFNVRLGRMKIYFGLAQNLDLPTRYYTTHRQEMENEILPLGWYENGVEFYGKFLNEKLHYRFFVTNGLDASGFSSRGWIKRGHQTRFEMINAGAFAFTGRLDYKFGTHKNTFVGLSAYFGDAAANMPKEYIKKTAYISMGEAHISYNEKNLRFNATALYGYLQNSDIVSKTNASLPNGLGVKRSPVGSHALGAAFEIGYDLISLWGSKTEQKLFPFFRFDYYDTMHKTAGVVVDNPRWERTAYTAGANWFIHPQIVFKAQYQIRVLGSEHFDARGLSYGGRKAKEKTFSAGIGFSF